MSKIKNYLLCILSGISIAMTAQAQTNNTNPYALMTAQDVRTNAVSNVTLTNQTGQPIAVNGLFIASFDFAATDNNCNACSGGITGGDNLGGTVASPFTIQTNQTAQIGQNYLYNMIYNGIYYIRNSIGSSSCSLPGCTWHGDDSTDVTGWCLSINAASPNSSYTYNTAYKNGSNPAAAIPAYGAAGYSPPIQFNYNYDLINPNTLGIGNACIGPITCNDKTLTCQVSSVQNESLQPYN